MRMIVQHLMNPVTAGMQRLCTGNPGLNETLDHIEYDGYCKPF